MKKFILIISFAFIFMHVFAQYESMETQSQFAEQKKEILNEAKIIKAHLQSVKTEYVLDSIIYYQFPTEDDSVLYSKIEYVYFGDTEYHKIEYLRDDISGMWVNFKKVTWILDEYENLLEYQRINWDLISGTWVNETKFVMEYDLAGHETLFVYYKWEETLEDWENFIKEEYDYDGNGNLILWWVWVWDENMNAWMGEQYQERYYSLTGKLIELIAYVWDTYINDWNEHYRSEHEYDNDDNLVLTKDYNWSSFLNNWSFDNKHEFTNTASGKAELILSYHSSDNGLTWDFSYKTEKTYNTEELEILSIHYYWDEYNMEWIFTNKDEFEWDEFEHRTLDKRYIWDETLNDWQVMLISQRSYYTNEIIESAEWYSYDISLELLTGDFKTYNFVNDDFKYTVKNEYVWNLSTEDWILDAKGFYHYTTTTNTFDQQENKFKIFPNPVQNELTLQLGNNEAVSYTIYAVSGAFILKGTVSDCNIKINLASLLKGVYIITINNNGETFSQQFVKE